MLQIFPRAQTRSCLCSKFSREHKRARVYTLGVPKKASTTADVLMKYWWRVRYIVSLFNIIVKKCLCGLNKEKPWGMKVNHEYTNEYKREGK